MRAAAIFTLLATLPLSAQEDAAAKKKYEESVEQALGFLKVMQEPDGSWHVFAQKHTAVSALSVMAFLSAGHVPGEGPHADVVYKGIKLVLAQQQPSGVFATEPGLEMYHH